MSKELEGIAGERLLGVSPQEVTGCGKRAQSSMGRRPEGGFPGLHSEPQELVLGYKEGWVRRVGHK